MSVPEGIGVLFTIEVPLELVPGRDGVAIAVDVTPSAPVKIPGSPGEVMTVFVRGLSDVTFQIGDSAVQATAASHPIFGRRQVSFLLPTTGKPCSHISMLSLGAPCQAIVNCYRRGT